MLRALPNKVSLHTGRGFPGLDDENAAAGAVSGAAQPGLDELQGFVNSGGLAQALARNPAGAAMLTRLLQQTAQKASLDQQQLGALSQGFGLGASPGSAQATAFNPLAQNQVPAVPSNGASALASSGADQQLADLAQLGGGGGFFEDRVFAVMCKVVEDYQKQIEQRLQNLQDQAQQAQASTQAGGQDTGGESRNIEFEKIKYDMQKLSQMQQAMSNILNSMDELAKDTIRHIKSGGG